MGHLKSLWDMVGCVMATFSAWHATLWDKIQVDELVEDTRKMIRDLKTLNKAVRGYEVYRRMPPQSADLQCCCMAPHGIKNVYKEHVCRQDAGGGTEGDADVAATGV